MVSTPKILSNSSPSRVAATFSASCWSSAMVRGRSWSAPCGGQLRRAAKVSTRSPRSWMTRRRRWRCRRARGRGRTSGSGRVRRAPRGRCRRPTPPGRRSAGRGELDGGACGSGKPVARRGLPSAGATSGRGGCRPRRRVRRWCWRQRAAASWERAELAVQTNTTRAGVASGPVARAASGVGTKAKVDAACVGVRTTPGDEAGVLEDLEVVREQV